MRSFRFDVFPFLKKPLLNKFTRGKNTCFFPLFSIICYKMAESLEETLDIIRLQEEKCQFTRFNSEDALQLGLLLIENVKPYKKSVVIDITVNGHQLFRYAMNGTSKDNDEWVRRKK